jgi:uncharacterized protein (TIGR00369 family)
LGHSVDVIDTSTAAAGSRISPADFLELIREGVPFSRYLHLNVESLVRGRARLRMPYHPDVLRPGGTISGPALMTLADCAMYAVLLSAIGRVELAVTTSMNINFLYRPPQADVLACGTLLKLGRRLAVMQVELLSDAHSESVAHVTGTYSIPPAGRD